MTRIYKLLLGLGLAVVLLAVPARAVNSLVWNTNTDIVNADVRALPLWPFLEDLAHKTGWHIFVEPGTDKLVSTKFKDLPAGEALKMVFGDLNYALVPQTNGPTCLYVFLTSMQNATKPVVTRKPATHVPNQLMVKLKPGTDADALAKKVGAKIIDRNDKLGIYLLEFPDAAATDAALGELKANPDVQAVDYNYNIDPPPPVQAVPSGTSLPPPTSLKLDPPSDNDPCNVVVGLVDTQIQPLSSDLAPFIMKPISTAGDPCPSSTPTHATAMAQTILSAISQSSGGHSSAKILPVDVYGCGETTTSWNITVGIVTAIGDGSTVINVSSGGQGDSTVMDSVVQQSQATGKIIIFAAAGNQPVDSPTYPAAIPGVNGVTAVEQGQLAPYANYGSFSDMALPDTSIIYLGSQAFMEQGTSVSTAYASGVAAGTKTSNCDGWPQIQSAMQQKFVVPAGK